MISLLQQPRLWRDVLIMFPIDIRIKINFRNQKKNVYKVEKDRKKKSNSQNAL